MVCESWPIVAGLSESGLGARMVWSRVRGTELGEFGDLLVAEGVDGV